MVTYFYRLFLVVTLGIPVLPRVNRNLKLIQMCIIGCRLQAPISKTHSAKE